MRAPMCIKCIRLRYGTLILDTLPVSTYVVDRTKGMGVLPCGKASARRQRWRVGVVQSPQHVDNRGASPMPRPWSVLGTSFQPPP